MKKKIFGVIIFCLVMAAVSAQEVKSFLTAGAVDSFVKNYTKIQTDLEGLGNKYDHVFDSMEGSDATNMIERIQAIKMPDEIEQIFKKYGMGDQGLVKMTIILMGTSALYLEDVVKEQEAQYANIPELADAFKQSKLQIEDLKKSISKSDMALITARKDALVALLLESE